MKIWRYVAGLYVMLVVFITSMIPVSTATGFTTEAFDEETKTQIIENYKITIITEKPATNGILFFDVNEAGWIALGFENMSEKIISVYDSDFTFQYAYIFEDSGSYGFQWAGGNNINIYSVRGSEAMTVSPSGECLDVRKILATKENREYWNEEIEVNMREVDGKQYQILNDMGILNVFANTYSRLIVTDKQGYTLVLYDVKSSQITKMVLWIVSIAVVVGGTIYCLVHQIRKAAKQCQQ